MKTKKQKHKEAQERHNQYNQLSIYEKITRLDYKFGINKGAKRQRKRFQKQLDE